MTSLERGSAGVSELPKLAFPDGSLLEYPVWTGLKEELRTDPIFIAMPEKPKGIRQRIKPVEIFSAARQATKPVENYAHRVGERIKPEAWTAAIATDLTSWVVLPVAQALIALNIHTGLDMTDPKLAVAAALTVTSLLADRYALSKEGWDISFVGCVAQAVSGQPTLSAITEHAINYIGPLNVVTLAAAGTGNLEFAAKNMLAAPFVLAPWFIVMNLLIGHGQADRVLKPIRRVEDFTLGKIRRIVKE